MTVEYCDRSADEAEIIVHTQRFQDGRLSEWYIGQLNDPDLRVVTGSEGPSGLVQQGAAARLSDSMVVEVAGCAPGPLPPNGLYTRDREPFDAQMPFVDLQALLLFSAPHGRLGWRLIVEEGLLVSAGFVDEADDQRESDLKIECSFGRFLDLFVGAAEVRDIISEGRMSGRHFATASVFTGLIEHPEAIGSAQEVRKRIEAVKRWSALVESEGYQQAVSGFNY